MKYRVEIDVSFDAKADALAILNYVEKIKDSAKSVASEKLPPLNVPKIARLSECRHDETPAQQCTGYESVDFSSPMKEWK